MSQKLALDIGYSNWIQQSVEYGLRELIKALKLVVAPGLDTSGPGASSVLLKDLKWRHWKIEACLEVIRDEAKSDLQVK